MSTIRFDLRPRFAALLLCIAGNACGGSGGDPASLSDFARELARAVTEGDTAALITVVETHYSDELVAEAGGAEALATGWLDDLRRYGPLEFHSRTREGDAPMLWLRGSRTGAWVGVKLALDETTEQQRIAGVGLRRGTSPPGRDRGEPLSDTILADSLAHYMRGMAEGGFFSGAVLVGRNGQIVHQSAHGMSDPNTGRANAIDTRFNIASTGKMFTGVAVSRLAEDGRLSLDDPLSMHLPELPTRIGDRVTVRDLLTHTSGIELDDIGAFQEATYAAETIEELLDVQVRFLDSVAAYADFERSGEFDYTNEGFNLAGVVIERAGGMPYAEYLRSFVFEPADMTDTGTDYGASEPPVARGLTYEGTVGTDRRPNDEYLPAITLPAGSHYSTAADLWHFSRALARHRLLGPNWTDSVTAMKVVEAELPEVTYGYGYGFEVIERDGFLSYGHAGGMPGASTKFEVYPELELTIVVLSNWDGAATMATNHIRELTLRR